MSECLLKGGCVAEPLVREWSNLDLQIQELYRPIVEGPDDPEWVKKEMIKANKTAMLLKLRQDEIMDEFDQLKLCRKCPY